MKKQLGTVVLAGALVFSFTSISAIAAGKTTAVQLVEDGRQGNGLLTGQISLVLKSDGPYYVGDTISISPGDVVIDGPLDTLKWIGTGQFDLSEAGTKTFDVSAETYFKNGKKAGLIHSSTAVYTVTVEVVEKEQAAVTVSSHKYDDYSYTESKNQNGLNFKGNVTFTLSNGETVTLEVSKNNVQLQQIEGNFVIVGYTFTSANGTVFEGSLPLPNLK